MVENTKIYRLKELRARYNLTQQEVADKVGITRQYYAILENDETRLLKASLEVILSLCELFKIDLNFFCQSI